MSVVKIVTQQDLEKAAADRKARQAAYSAEITDQAAEELFGAFLKVLKKHPQASPWGVLGTVQYWAIDDGILPLPRVGHP